MKVLLAEVIRRRENGENVALIDDKIKTFPAARRGTGDGGPQVGPYPARTNCTDGKKDGANNEHISQLNVEVNTFPCYYSNFQSIRNKFNEITVSVDNNKPLIIDLTRFGLVQR